MVKTQYVLTKCNCIMVNYIKLILFMCVCIMEKIFYIALLLDARTPSKVLDQYLALG